jgi:hypothetical protein
MSLNAVIPVGHSMENHCGPMPRSLRALFVLMTLAFIEAPGPASAAVSDEKVRMWIASALEGVPAPTDAAAKNALAKVRKASDSFSAWKKLKECRDAGKSLDLELASAEHYLFIRSFAAEKGERDVEALPALYGDAKDKLGPAAQLLKTSDQPVSKPDSAVVVWGERGVAAGLADFSTATGKEPVAKSGKLNEYKLALQGYYDNYTATAKNPSCKVSP